ncbi:MAG TPA: GFA family protein [Paracoccaceae bacterium]|nr:GFA family protein [Paracoccaceae bacterium]
MTGRIETGRCFCGAIAARMTGEPFWICFDHDDDCRRAIGGPMTVWIGYRPDQIRFTKGEPASFSKTPGVVRTFCSRCGTSIGYNDEGLAAESYLSIGFMDRPERFAPAAHAGWKEKLSWLHVADGLDRTDMYTRPRDPAVGYPDARRPDAPDGTDP